MLQRSLPKANRPGTHLVSASSTESPAANVRRAQKSYPRLPLDPRPTGQPRAPPRFPPPASAGQRTDPHPALPRVLAKPDDRPCRSVFAEDDPETRTLTAPCTPAVAPAGNFAAPWLRAERP